jgi:hypothetical protein
MRVTLKEILHVGLLEPAKNGLALTFDRRRWN